MRVEFYHIDAMQAPHNEPIWRALCEQGVDARLVAIPGPENAAPAGWFDFDRLKHYYDSRHVPFYTETDYDCSAVTTGSEPLLRSYRAWHIRLSYGPVLHPDSWNHRESTNRPFDAVLVHGPFDVECLSQWKSRDDLLVMGYPRYDEFFAGAIDVRADRSLWGLDSSRPTIVYLPTWEERSSIDRFLDVIAGLQAQYNVLVKPHHCTLRMEQRRMARIRQSGLTLIESPYDLPACLAVADLVVADTRSGAFNESIMTDNRTVGLADSPEEFDQWLVPCGITRLAPVCTLPAALPSLAAQVLEKDEYGFVRQEWADRNVSYRDGTAALHAAEEIIKYLERQESTSGRQKPGSCVTPRADSAAKEDGANEIDADKKQAELDYWIRLSKELAKDCASDEEREKALLKVCYEKTFPRYKESLHLGDDAFAGKRILDVGCGPHCGIIGFRDCERYGIDHLIDDYKRIGYPLDEHGVHYVNGKSENMPFDDAFFDVVVCVNALDHVDDLEKTVGEISRVLKPGGSFIGQFNFRTRPTKTEPICLDREALLNMSLAHGLICRNTVFQYHLTQTAEDRYYYEFEKDTANPPIGKALAAAERFLDQCIRNGLAHSYDVTRQVWVKPYPEVTGYLLSYFAGDVSDRDVPPTVMKAADTLLSMQHRFGGFHSFADKCYLFTFDTAQIMHGMASVFKRTASRAHLRSAIACAEFVCRMQLPDGSMFPMYDLQNAAKYVDQKGGWGRGFSCIQAKNIEGLLLVAELTGEPKYRQAADSLAAWAKQHCDLIYTHPGAYCLEGLWAHGEHDFVRRQLQTVIVPRIRENGFLAYSEDLPYAYVSGSVQMATLLFKTGLKEESRRILEWARLVQSHHMMGGLFQYAAPDGSLDTHVHTEMNSWGTKYFAQLERLWQ
jgi:SAM-dependent methyltransferase